MLTAIFYIKGNYKRIWLHIILYMYYSCFGMLQMLFYWNLGLCSFDKIPFTWLKIWWNVVSWFWKQFLKMIDFWCNLTDDNMTDNLIDNDDWQFDSDAICNWCNWLLIAILENDWLLSLWRSENEIYFPLCFVLHYFDIVFTCY